MDRFNTALGYVALACVLGVIVLPFALIALFLLPFVAATYTGYGIYLLFRHGGDWLNDLIDWSGLDVQYKRSKIVLTTSVIDASPEPSYLFTVDVYEPLVCLEPVAEPVAEVVVPMPVPALDLSALKVPALRLMAKERGIKGYGKMNKAGLIEMLTAAKAAAAA